MHESVAWLAFFWGGLSAVSLPIGALLGIWTQPTRKVTSALMAFGGGALLFALSIELFGHVLHEAGDGHGHVVEVELVLAAMISAILGGVLFNALNKMLDSRGGFLRRRVLIRRHVAKARRAEALQLIGALSRVHYFRSLPVEDVISLLPDVKREEFAAGSTLLTEGEVGDRLFVVAEGDVAIRRATNGGTSENIATLGPGNVIGEMALVTDQPRSATATALTDVHTWSINKADFDHHIEQSPKLKESIREVVEQRIHDLENRGHVTAEEAGTWEKQALRRLDDPASHAMLAGGDIEAHHQPEGNPALAIWLGIALDGIPESLVIGMLTLAAAARNESFSLAFIVGVFLANLPEAMSSAVTMRSGGMKVARIMTMWMSLCLMTAVGALIGSQILPAHPTGWHLYIVFTMEGLAGGAMLTMIAQTMLPEAFEQGGGPIVGYSTLAGFIAALAVKLIH